MTSPSVQPDPNFTAFRHLPVYRCRIAVHTLGVYLEGMTSENHLIIYLLLGGDRSFQLDMRPRTDTDELETAGNLVMRSRLYHMSDTVIRFADVDAIGCPVDFSPTRRTTPSSACRSVGQFVSLAIGNGFQNYRFTFMDGHPLACRTWVHEMMDSYRRNGYLLPDTDFTEQNGANPSLEQLVLHRWDATHPPIRQVSVPGMLLPHEPSSQSMRDAIRLLAMAEISSIRVLCQSLAPRDEDDCGEAAQVLTSRSSVAERRSGILTIDQLANMRGFEISHAYDMLLAQMEFFTALHAVAVDRYGLVVNVLRHLVVPLRNYQETQNGDLRPNLFTLLLAVVVDMSGPEDE
ncbi:hypothetical protein LTR95_012134 [Oleoguttula sp. CCFEE 5521]